MAIVSRIQKPIVPRDHIPLNRPPTKEQNIAPELAPAKRFHRNTPPLNNLFTAATLRHNTADTKRHNKCKTTHRNLETHLSSHTQPPPQQQRPAGESFRTSPRQHLNALYFGLTA
jgi:hypothetical protein